MRNSGSLCSTLPDLEELFAPHGVAAFKREAVARHAMHVAGRPERFREIADWHALNHLMTYGGFSYPRLRIVQGQEDVAPSEYSSTGTDGYSKLLVSGVLALLRNGATLVIDAVDELLESVSDLCRAFESALNLSVNAEMYASSPGEKLRPLSWNDDEALLLQVEGERQWWLFEPTAHYPVATSTPPEPTGDPRWEGTVRSGDILYIPRGWWYRETALREPSLHVVVRFKMPRGVDIVWRLLNLAADKTIMRMDVPLSTEDLEAQSSYLTCFQDELTELCRRPGLLLGLRRDVQLASVPRVGFALPWGIKATADPLCEHWVVVPLVRLLKQGPLDKGQHGSVEINVNGSALSLQDDEAKILERLWESRLSTVGELTRQCANTITPADVAGGISGLIDKGAVYVRESR